TTDSKAAVRSSFANARGPESGFFSCFERIGSRIIMATLIWQEDRSEQKSSFWSVGHKPTLIAAFLYFDLAFMVWVLLGPLAPDIAKALALTPAEKGLMVATPTLAGAVLRVVNGLLVDRIG